MAIPDFQSIMLPLLRLVGDGKIHSAKQIYETLAAEFDLSDEELLEITKKSRKPVFQNRVDWAKAHLSMADLIETPERGCTKISESGMKLLSESPRTLRLTDLKAIESYRIHKQKSIGNSPTGALATNTDSGDGNNTPNELMNGLAIMLEQRVASDLEHQIRRLDWRQFQELSVRLLHAMGYGGTEEEIERARKLGQDGGLDGVISIDMIGFEKVYVQAKHFSDGNRVSEKYMRDFIGSMEREGGNKGLFITSSEFQESAVSLAINSRNFKIVLIDKSELIKLMIKLKLGLRVVQTIEELDIDADFFQNMEPLIRPQSSNSTTS